MSSSRSKLRGRIARLATGAAAVAVVLGVAIVPASPALADSWSGYRECYSPETLYVRSYAGAGFVNHLRYDTLIASWSNSGSTWRTSIHGTGYQLAKINTGGALTQQQAYCGPEPV